MEAVGHRSIEQNQAELGELGVPRVESRYKNTLWQFADKQWQATVSDLELLPRSFEV